MVSRVARNGRPAYVAREDASAWAVAQPSMASYLVPTLEFIASLQSGLGRNSTPAQG